MRVAGSDSRLSYLSWVWIAVLVAAAAAFAWRADLTPKVDSGFFFSGSSEAVREDAEISRLFDSNEQLIVSAEGPIRDYGYLIGLEDLTSALLNVKGVNDVKSLVRGPNGVDHALASPLWRRLLVGPDEKSSLLMLLIASSDTGAIVGRVEAVVARHRKADFDLRVAGASYVAEMIRRNLVHDMSMFAGAALGVFSVVLLAIFRSLRIVAGSTVAGGLAVIVTLTIQMLLGIPIGVLTANLAVVVFVLTQSHVIFMTGNWQSAAGDGRPADARAAVATTVVASTWSMITTLLGFLSLLLVDAEPLRQLGIGGATGTVTAFAAAYLVFPSFLAWQGFAAGNVMGAMRRRLAPLWRRRRSLAALALAAVIVAPAIFIPTLDFDPSLLEYFKKGGEIRNSLEYIDERGGSSILNVVVADKHGRSLAQDEPYKRMWAMQDTLAKDDAVGVIVSLPVLMAEGNTHPLSFLIPWEMMLRLLRTPQYERVARSFISEDSKQALFILRMRESARTQRRTEVLDRIAADVRKNDFVPTLMGGIYFLQSKLAAQIRTSVVEGLALLTVAFALISLIAARAVRSAFAMTTTLLVLAAGLLGTLGLLGVPIDIISAPATNVAIGIALDAMIHTAIAARRAARRVGGGGLGRWQHWSAACSEQSASILTSAMVVSIGFGLFGLSTFPPTQRFGMAIAGGSLVAAMLALFVMPVLASRRQR